MKRRGLFVALALLASACGDKGVPTSIETPRGTVTFKDHAVPKGEKFKDGVRDMSSAELQEIHAAAARARSFIEKYVPADKRQADLLENLDLAFAAWLLSPQLAKESAAEVEAIVASALGEYSIQRLPNLRWAVVTDENGTEVALVGTDPTSRSYPRASVRYRIEDKKSDFIGALYETLAHLRKQPAEKP